MAFCFGSCHNVCSRTNKTYLTMKSNNKSILLLNKWGGELGQKSEPKTPKYLLIILTGGIFKRTDFQKTTTLCFKTLCVRTRMEDKTIPPSPF